MRAAVHVVATVSMARHPLPVIAGRKPQANRTVHSRLAAESRELGAGWRSEEGPFERQDSESARPPSTTRLV